MSNFSNFDSLAQGSFKLWKARSFEFRRDILIVKWMESIFEKVEKKKKLKNRNSSFDKIYTRMNINTTICERYAGCREYSSLLRLQL